MPTKKDAGSGQWTDPDDAPVLTLEEAHEAEVFHGDLFIRRRRGRPTTGNAKELISVRLDPDVVAKLREAGPGWQSQINSLLRNGLGMSSIAQQTSEDTPGMVMLRTLEFDKVVVHAKVAGEDHDKKEVKRVSTSHPQRS